MRLSCPWHKLVAPGGLSLCSNLSTEGAAVISTGSMFHSLTVFGKKECLNCSECVLKYSNVSLLFLARESTATKKSDAGTLTVQAASCLS